MVNTEKVLKHYSWRRILKMLDDSKYLWIKMNFLLYPWSENKLLLLQQSEKNVPKIFNYM
jgi:hypothetical protein